MQYAIIASYAGVTEEELECPAHNVEILGYTEDPEAMRQMAQTVFTKMIDEDLELHAGYYDAEELQELRDGVEVILYPADRIQQGMDEQRSVPSQIIVGTLYNFNERFRYVDHVIVSAIPTIENNKN